MHSKISDTADAEEPSADAEAPLADVEAPLSDTARDAVKIVISGGFGVGKTTFVRAVSEIDPLTTEAVMTEKGVGVDDVAGVEGKSATTVAFDFGRISVTERIVTYLFGAPGQNRFRFLWDNLFLGAWGAVVLVDTRRLEDSFPVIDHLERKGMPFIVAHNRFDDSPDHTLDAIRGALDLADGIPLVACDARSHTSGKDVLVALLDHLHTLSAAQEAAS